MRSVWAGMAKILESMRDEPGMVHASVYARLKMDRQLVPNGASVLDWEYTHVSNKLLMVLNAHLYSDPMKMIDEFKEQCGFEADRLLGRAYDPLIVDTEHVLLSHVVALSSRSVK